MLKIYFLCLFLYLFNGYGQTIHKVPVASKDNVIELAFNNSSKEEIKNLKIEVTQAPDWLVIRNKETIINGIKSYENKSASFSFDINKEVVVDEKGEIVFKITDNKNNAYHKTINVVTTPPDKFELMQNYPNPFNPATTISFLIPKQSFVNLSVYNLLGERVEILINEEKLPGFYQVEFNANNIASGVYFYTLKSDNYLQTKKMVILK